MNGFLQRRVLVSFGLGAVLAGLFAVALLSADGVVGRFVASVLGGLSLTCVALGFYYVNHDRVFSEGVRGTARRLARGWAGFYFLVEGITAATPLTDSGGWHWLSGAFVVAGFTLLRAFHPDYEGGDEMRPGSGRRLLGLGSAACVYTAGVALVEGWVHPGFVPGVTATALGIALWLSGLSIAVATLVRTHRQLTADTSEEPEDRDRYASVSETKTSLE